jgi:AraC family transcriptional regulator
VQLSPPAVFREQSGGRVEVVRLAPGDVIFRPAGVPAQAGWDGPSEVINVALEPEAVEAAPAESFFGPDPVVHHLALALLEQLAGGEPPERLFVDAVRTALAEHLRSRYRGSPIDTSPRRLAPAELARVRERVDAELADELRLADLAAAVPLSPYHFSRVFKATTGMTPHGYVMRCRTDAARSLLTRGDLDLDEIARRTGFADGPHLARRFRRRFGLSPAQFRATVRRA